jgi:hypothetical protein
MMGDRVAYLQAEERLPGVAIDPRLGEEQGDRSLWLPRCFDRIARHEDEATKWDAVFDAIAQIESLPAFAARGNTRLS